jgi:dysferlin
MDLGSVYDQPQHTYLQRWLLLSSAADERSTAGYLKVSVAVLGPGDEAPSFHSSGYGKSAAETWGDDMETSVLYPSGIALTPAGFTLSVYRAEDLPRSKCQINVSFSKQNQRRKEDWWIFKEHLGLW